MAAANSIPVQPSPIPAEDWGLSISHETLGGSVYASLSEALAKGRLKPDDRLRIRDLAAVLGTSVTPVRDAILRLVQDRALVLRSSRDIRVPLLSARDYLEIREIRLSLEGMAAERAAERGLPADAERLDAILRDNEAAFARGDMAAATELNQVFHFALADIAQMPILKDIVSRLWLRIGPVIADIYRTSTPALIAAHYDVVNAVRSGDPPAAAAAIRRDIVAGGEHILERLAPPGEAPATDWGGTD